MSAAAPSPLPLDENGLLPDRACVLPSPAEAYMVFAQQADARIDEGAWRRNAKQFFQADLHLTRPKQYGATLPTTDGAHVVLARDREPAVMRTVFVRPRAASDLASAEAASRSASRSLRSVMSTTNAMNRVMPSTRAAARGR